jgi:hypothetical protein
MLEFTSFLIPRPTGPTNTFYLPTKFCYGALNIPTLTITTSTTEGSFFKGASQKLLAYAMYIYFYRGHEKQIERGY